MKKTSPVTEKLLIFFLLNEEKHTKHKLHSSVNRYKCHLLLNPERFIWTDLMWFCVKAGPWVP